MKKIAVIVAAYDSPNYILDCIKSIEDQKIQEGWTFDIRVGVDGCKQTAAVMCRKLIKGYLSDKNVGAYIMRNSLIMLKKADYYSYFDADDVMLPDYLFETIEKLKKGANAVMCAKYQCDENLKKIKKDPIIETGGAMTFSHKIWETIGGYHPFRCAGDSDYMERIKGAGFKIEEIEEGLYSRRRHDKSLTKSGMTRYGGSYRKNVWTEMTKIRNTGKLYVEPVVTKLRGI